MIYIVYITTCIPTDQIYIGVHGQEKPYEFDGYLGSGSWRGKGKRPGWKTSLSDAIRQYGKNAFKRETLFYYWTQNQALAHEAEIVTDDFIKHDWNFNLTPGGKVPPSAKGKPSHRRGKRGVYRQSTLNALSAAAIRNGNKPPRMTRESGLKAALTRRKTGTYRGGPNAKPYVYKSEETRMNSLEHLGGVGSDNPMYGSTFRWITSGQVNRRWTENHDNLPSGFRFGRTNWKPHVKRS